MVFAAPLFALSITVESLLGSLLAFILFCCASSGFYLINDIADVESDRQHPVKCKRPIAAGKVRIPVAIGMAVLLLGSALTIGWWRSLYLGAAITAYALLQIAYNLRLKRMVILDIGAIATGFVLRAFAGAAATGIILSAWFILCTAMLALFLGIEKRKAELRLTQVKGGKPRAVLKRYSLPLLSRMENVVTTGTVVTYALWSAGPYLHGASTSWMLLTLGRRLDYASKVSWIAIFYPLQWETSLSRRILVSSSQYSSPQSSQKAVDRCISSGNG